MPTTTPVRSTVTWGPNSTARNVGVKRLADTAENRRKLQEEAAKDQLPSAIVDLGDDVALISGRELVTASRLARTAGPVLKVGEKAAVDGLNGTTLYTDDGFREIEAAKEVVVAVIDTGLDINHPAFKDRVVKPYNAVTGSADVTDLNGHGTHCAGIVGGSWEIDPKAGGVAPQVKIMPIKAGDGSFSADAIVKGIRYAADNGAKVISMSLGGKSAMPEVRKAMEYALSKGCVIVSAAGNDGKNTISFPAQYDQALSIGSSKDGKRSSFSNGGDRLDLSAPGEQIYSTLPTGKSEIGDKVGKNGYGAISGTSMATPYVAGTVALVMAMHPDWKPEQVKEHMKRAVNDLGAPGWDKDFGYGEVNMFKAVYGDELPAVTRPAPAPKQGFFQRLLAMFGLA